jgi:hypothetical protein
VRPYGEDIALATGRYTSRGVLATGKAVEQDSRFTALWIKRDGRWQSAAHQAGNIGEQLF